MTAGAAGVGALFCLLASGIGYMVVAALRTGVVYGRYGTSVSRSSAPRRFRFAIVAFAILSAICLMFAALAFTSPVL